MYPGLTPVSKSVLWAMMYGPAFGSKSAWVRQLPVSKVEPPSPELRYPSEDICKVTNTYSCKHDLQQVLLQI